MIQTKLFSDLYLAKFYFSKIVLFSCIPQLPKNVFVAVEFRKIHITRELCSTATWHVHQIAKFRVESAIKM